MVKLKNLFILFLWVTPYVSFSQDIIKEIIPLDTSYITYKVIHKETKGDYFEIKRYVFADDTSVIAIEKNFSNGNQNGITRVYYPSGKLRIKALYGNNKLQGEWVLYDEEGEIITKGVYNFGIKHGYWAYKKQRTYGRYIKGKKHRNWKKKDKNGVKHKAWYWRGKFKRGADIFKDDYVTYEDTVYVASNDGYVKENEIVINVDEKYINAANYLSGNYYLRKITKDYFRPNKKQRKIFVDENVNYEKDIFKFQVAPVTVPIDVSYFIQQKKLVKPVLDSLINVNGESIKNQLASGAIKEEKDLKHLSTDKGARMILYFSQITDNLVSVEFVEKQNDNEIDFNQVHSDSNNIRMKALILFDENNKVIEVEYQAREW